MKQFGIVLAAVFVGVFAVTPAFADGFTCQSADGLNVKVYDSTDKNVGTRTASVMVLSDANIGGGNKTIAVFRNAAGTLNSQGTVYAADVDLRFTEISRKGELIGGTKLGQLKSVTLSVAHSFSAPVANGTQLDAELSLDKRDGSFLVIDMSCQRYLKN